MRKSLGYRQINSFSIHQFISLPGRRIDLPPKSVGTQLTSQVIEKFLTLDIIKLRFRTAKMIMNQVILYLSAVMQRD